MTLFLPVAKNNAEGQLDSNIGASSTSIVLGTGEGALFPTVYRSTTSSSGTSTTLNKTGIGSSGIAVGDFIENLTDGSYAYVTAVSTDSLTTTVLLGGSDNTWASGDTYAVGRFLVTLNSRDADGVVIDSEIALIGNRSSDTLTVETGGRGYAGTTAQTWDASDYVSNFVMAEHVNNVIRALGALASHIKDLQDEKADLTFVNAALTSMKWKEPVRVASTANVTIASGLENGDTIDGITLATGDRVLLKDQSTTSQNGIYVVVASGAASRATDFDADDEVEGALVAVQEGTTYANSVFMQTAENPVVGTDALTFTQFGAASVTSSQAEAEAGVNNTTYMTPQRTEQHYNQNYAKGSIIVGTGSRTYDDLAVGSDGFVIQAKASATPGVEWANPFGLGGKGAHGFYSFQLQISDLFSTLGTGFTVDTVKLSYSGSSTTSSGYGALANQLISKHTKGAFEFMLDANTVLSQVDANFGLASAAAAFTREYNLGTASEYFVGVAIDGSTGKIFGKVQNGATVQNVDLGAIATGDFKKIRFEWDASNVYFYVDNTLGGTGGAGGTISTGIPSLANLQTMYNIGFGVVEISATGSSENLSMYLPVLSLKF